MLKLQIAWFFQDVSTILLIMLPWMFRSPVNLCRLLVVGIIPYPVVSCEFSKILKYVDSVKQYVHKSISYLSRELHNSKTTMLLMVVVFYYKSELLCHIAIWKHFVISILWK